MGGSGGIASTLHVMFDSKVFSGAEKFFSRFIEQKLLNYDEIIFTEGQYDETSKYGKIASKALNFANTHGKNIVGFFALDTSTENSSFKRYAYLDQGWSGNKEENKKLLVEGLKVLRESLIYG